MSSVIIAPFDSIVGALEALAYAEAKEFLRDIKCPHDMIEDEARKIAVTCYPPADPGDGQQI